MSDFPNKIVTIILVFVMLVIAPITWSYVRSEMVAQRLALNEVSQFIDKVTNKGTINQADIDDLYMSVNATGGAYDVQIKRYILYATPPDPKDPQHNARTAYLSVDYLKSPLNLGDIVKVTVQDIGISPAKRLLWSLLRIDEGQTKFSLAGTVR